MKFDLGKCRKHCEKRRKCWLPAFSLFPAMFSKGFFPGIIKTWHCFGNGFRNAMKFLHSSMSSTTL